MRVPSCLTSSKIKFVFAFLVLSFSILIGGLGIELIENATNDPTPNGTTLDWNYLNAVYFTTGAILTIGFDDFYPTSSGGKAWVVFHTAISILFVGIAIEILSRALLNSLDNEVADSLKKLEHHNPKENKDQQDQDTWNRVMDGLISWHRYIIGWSLYAMWLLVGAGVFSSMEGWSYGNALYFCYMTLTTIGIGTDVPTTNGAKVFFIFYSLSGIGILSFMISEFARNFSTRVSTRVKEAITNDTTKLSDLQLDKETIAVTHIIAKLQKDVSKLSDKEELKEILKAVKDLVEEKLGASSEDETDEIKTSH